jgi:hypothetical protein
LTGRLPSHAIVGVNRFSTASLKFTGVIPEIDIWRAANLMLKRYGEKALEESSTRADELAADGDHDGASTWRRITVAVEQLANNVPPGPVTDRNGPETVGPPPPGVLLENKFYPGPRSTNVPGPKLSADFDFRLIPGDGRPGGCAPAQAVWTAAGVRPRLTSRHAVLRRVLTSRGPYT